MLQPTTALRSPTTMPNNLLFLTAVLVLMTGTSSASRVRQSLKCIDYGGGTPKVTANVTLPANIVDCDANNPGSTATPCYLTCPTGSDTYCHNSYKAGVNSEAGCVLGASCETGTTADGTHQKCCTTDNCNTATTYTFHIYPHVTTKSSGAIAVFPTVAGLVAAALVTHRSMQCSACQWCRRRAILSLVTPTLTTYNADICPAVLSGLVSLSLPTKKEQHAKAFSLAMSP
jgi:hypothetical protein